MPRSLPNSSAKALQGVILRPALLLSADVTPAVNVWTGVGNITVDSTTYTGLGDFLSVTPITESAEVAANSLSVTLSGIPTANMVFALDDSANGKRLDIKMVLFSEEGALIDGDPIHIYSGLIETVDIALSGDSASISVNTSNKLSELFSTNASRYTNEEQQRRYPGDVGLSYIAEIQNKEFTWG